MKEMTVTAAAPDTGNMTAAAPTFTFQPEIRTQVKLLTPGTGGKVKLMTETPLTEASFLTDHRIRTKHMIHTDHGTVTDTGMRTADTAKTTTAAAAFTFQTVIRG